MREAKRIVFRASPPRISRCLSRQFADSGGGEIGQCTELVPVERLCLGRPLNLDEETLARHHEIHVHFGARILGVVEIEKGSAVDYADADGGDVIRHGDRVHHPALLESSKEIDQGDEPAGDGGGSCSAVGLDDIAVNRDRPLAECVQVGDGPQGTADQALDLVGPPPDLPDGRFAGRPLLGRGGKHRVFRGQPASPRILEKGGNLFLDRRRTDHPRMPHLHQDGSLREMEKIAGDPEVAQPVPLSVAVPSHRSPPLTAS